MDKYISFNQFTFQYDAQAEATLKDISFDIVKGEKVLILGPSGSGKSTLAQCLNGIIPNIHKGQAKGQVRIDGQAILLFDEPLANLDPKSGQETIDLIDKIHKEEGATTIIIEHRLEDVLYRPVDRILLVNDGTLLFNGSPDELLSSTLLLENGIREPLYVTVLRQLGFDTRSAQNLSQLDALDLSGLALPDRVLKDKKDSSSDSILKVEGLSVSYGDNPAIIEDLSFSLKKGERLAIVGKNGAGKSTLAKALCGFVPSQGKLTYKGQDISQDSIAERSERIGFVLQNPNQMTYTDIMNFLDSLQKQGHTIVMITHDMQLMLEYSDRCLVVVEGKIIADDNPVTILNQKDLLESANLKQTSLYTLGQKLSSDPVEVTQYYIEKGGPNV